MRWHRRWWLAGGVAAVVSVLQRTLGHVTQQGPGDDTDDAGAVLADLTRDDDSGAGSPERKNSDEDADADAPRAGVRFPSHSRQRVSALRSVRLPPLTLSSPRTRPPVANSWLFDACEPSADDVALRCLEVLYQVALVAAGDEGVGGTSGGRTSGLSGQRSSKLYTPPARIFQELASPPVVAVVALVGEHLPLSLTALL